MSKGYENFNNMETSFRKSTLIQERIGLVSTHMYKQFLDYQHATMNTTEIFAEMIDNLKATADSLKQSFAARGVTTENIYVNHDKDLSRHRLFLFLTKAEILLLRNQHMQTLKLIPEKQTALCLHIYE